MHSHARTKQANGTPRDLVNSIPVVLSSPAAAAFLSRGEIFLSALFSSFVFFLESFLWSLGRDNEKDWTNALLGPVGPATRAGAYYASRVKRVEISNSMGELERIYFLSVIQ